MVHLGELLLQQLLQIPLGAAGQDLGHKGAPGGQYVEGQIGRRLAKRDDPQVIGLLVPRGRGRHVGHDHIGLAPQPGLHLLVGTIGHEIKLVNLGAGDWIDLLQIDAQDGAHGLALLLAQGVDPGHGHLDPATGGTAQIDDPRTGHKEAKLVVQLHDLEGGAPAIALGPGAGHVGIVQLPLQPARRRQLAPPRGLYLHGQIPLATPRCVLAGRFLGHGPPLLFAKSIPGEPRPAATGAAPPSPFARKSRLE